MVAIKKTIISIIISKPNVLKCIKEYLTIGAAAISLTYLKTLDKMMGFSVHLHLFYDL